MREAIAAAHVYPAAREASSMVGALGVQPHCGQKGSLPEKVVLHLPHFVVVMMGTVHG